ncbi:MAG: alcohol dehydrogenase catalytic domain-containing protein [Candidatus Aminicenantes bacterium]|nr:alcohol dehydrogenase catalytic domain-containing protein [Candidatus Aminicenantes bacterium]
MKQAILEKPQKIVFREAKKPEIADNEVLIKIKRIGICGSDIKAYYGKHPYIKCPIIQGHEFSGVVADLGRKVKKLRVGDKVTVRPQLVCGRCYLCKRGEYNICENLRVIGCQAEGAAQEFLKVDSNLVVRLPKKMSFEEGAMVEPVAVAVHAVGRAGRIRGNKVLVLGAGTIGNLTAQVAKSLGAKSVMITDLSNFRLRMARECGVDFTVNAGRTSLPEHLEKHFGPSKADLIFECVGEEKTINQAISVARKGSRIVVVGVFDYKPRTDVGLVQDRELSLIGSLMYKAEDYDAAIKLINTGRIKLRPLMSRTFHFDDYPRAYRFLEKSGDRVMKVFIKF